MTGDPLTFRNGLLFDGTQLKRGHAIRFENGRMSVFSVDAEVPTDGMQIDLGGDILGPGYVDLQVNGGNGLMFNDDPSVQTLERIAQAHRSLGVSALLPTLITDSPEITRAAIAAAIEATRRNIPGIAGLHLEGPHLSIARKGAHDAALIRPMETQDLSLLLQAAKELPCLKVTLAPENVTEEQVSTLARAGVLVSLGHTDADFDTCMRYFSAGARCVTHLFNAMSQLGSRAPGLVGAALAHGDVSAGVISDAVHVHPETLRAAWAAKKGPGRLFLVSDSMAVAGTSLSEFRLGGRVIQRRDGVLSLSDGTLAGADLDMTTAIRVLVERTGVGLADALAAATTVPSALIDRPARHAALADMIRISPDLETVCWAKDQLREAMV